MTLHRPSNVDQRETLAELLNALDDLAGQMPVVFPIHPRTRQRIQDFGLSDIARRVTLLEPLGYLEALSLVEKASLVLTDSGGFRKRPRSSGYLVSPPGPTPNVRSPLPRGRTASSPQPAPRSTLPWPTCSPAWATEASGRDAPKVGTAGQGARCGCTSRAFRPTSRGGSSIDCSPHRRETPTREP